MSRKYLKYVNIKSFHFGNIKASLEKKMFQPFPQLTVHFNNLVSRAMYYHHTGILPRMSINMPLRIPKYSSEK